MTADFWFGFFIGANVMASVALYRIGRRGGFSPKWPEQPY